ncbi:MAG: nuclease, partial [Bacteroidetes bacterium]
NSFVSRLVVMEDIQFADFELGATYGDLSTGFSAQNRTIQDCAGNTAILRNSNFADFADQPLPEGRGDLTAVVSVFGTTVQFLIRDETDVNFAGERCGSGPVEGELADISTLRAAFAGGATNAPANTKIRGVVISDRINGNTNGRNLVLQDNSGGITLRFDSDHSFNLGEELEVNVSGQELSEFRGLVQLNNLPLTVAQSQGEGTLPAPRVATISELVANGEAWESTLVQIEGATISGGPTWGDGATISDGTGSLNIFTFRSASFGGDAIPTGQGTLTAILSDFDGLQLNIRNRDDIDFEGGGGGGDPVDITAAELRAAFAGGATNVMGARKIRGVVISDRDNGNTNSQNIVLQDASGGIVIRFTEDHNFSLGEDVEVVVSGQELSEFRTLLQVNNVPLAKAVSYGTTELPAPRVATISEIQANGEAWESTLVRIDNAFFASPGLWDGVSTLSDPTGQLSMFTSGRASFNGQAQPTGTFSIIGIVSEFEGDRQIYIRNLSDIIE